MEYKKAHLNKQYNNHRLFRYVPDYNPLGLPPYTIRVLLRPNFTPSFSNPSTQLSVEPNIWDITYVNDNWNHELLASPYDARRKVYEVLGANTENITCMSGMLKDCISMSSVALFDTSKVTNMYFMFSNCDSISSVPLYNTSNVSNMEWMFDNCTELRYVPLLDTRNVVSMKSMFSVCSKIETLPLLDTSNVTSMEQICWNCSSLKSIPLYNTNKVVNMDISFESCYNVDTGALALYNQVSTQANPPTNHYSTFASCGRDSQTGSAELAQIPSDWK